MTTTRRRRIHRFPGDTPDVPPGDERAWTEQQPGARGGDDNAWNSNLQDWGDVPSRITPVTLQETGDVGGPPVAVRQGPGLLGSTLSIYPMWLYPPASARRYFVEAKNVVVLAGAINQVISAALVAVAGQGELGVLNWVGLTVNNPLNTMTMTFSVMRNGAPVAGLDRLSTASITAASVMRDFSPAYRFRQGDTITVFATNPDLVNWNVNVGIEGWTWSETEGRELTGNSPYANG